MQITKKVQQAEVNITAFENKNATVENKYNFVIIAKKVKALNQNNGS